MSEIVVRPRIACHDCDWTSDRHSEAYRHESQSGHFIYPVPTEGHKADVHGYGFQMYWACSCGRSGRPTTQGRADAGRARHLRAALRVAESAT